MWMREGTIRYKYNTGTLWLVAGSVLLLILRGNQDVIVVVCLFPSRRSFGVKRTNIEYP